jgi:hypothetical protein
MHDGFGVAIAPEDVSFLLESFAQFRVVVDLTVECDPDGAVLVGQRLSARFTEINDTEPAMPQRDPVDDVRPVRIRSPMRQRALHALQQTLVGPIESTDPAHDRALSLYDPSQGEEE